MRQRQITHPLGTFAACACCKKEPRHFCAAGRTEREGVQFGVVSDRHQLESACGRRTGWLASLTEAERAWGKLGETLPLDLPAPVLGNVRPLRQRGRAPA